MTNDAGDSRRTAVPFDPYHFERLAGADRVYSPEQAS